MTLAEETREAVRRHPFLHEGLRAGVVNYTATARFLDVDGETDAVVAALRRFADDLPAYERPGGGPPVSVRSGLGQGDPADALVVVGDLALVPDAGSLTAVIASGIGDPTALRRVLGCLAAHGIPIEAAAGGEALVVVTERRHGPDALRVVEDALGDR